MFSTPFDRRIRQSCFCSSSCTESARDFPTLRPQRGTTLNVLLLHGQLPGVGEQRGTMEYGGALVQLQDLAPAQWDYVALGHYHVARQVEKNAWYAGSLEYVAPNPWGQQQDEEEHRAQ